MVGASLVGNGVRIEVLIGASTGVGLYSYGLLSAKMCT
jgi:hypothetical protein